MSILTIRLPEAMLQEIDAYAQIKHIPRTTYIREALTEYNAKINAIERKEKLIKASLRTRKNSMRINSEFGKIEHDPTT